MTSKRNTKQTETATVNESTVNEDTQTNVNQSDTQTSEDTNMTDNTTANVTSENTSEQLPASEQTPESEQIPARLADIELVASNERRAMSSYLQRKIESMVEPLHTSATQAYQDARTFAETRVAAMGDNLAAIEAGAMMNGVALPDNWKENPVDAFLLASLKRKEDFFSKVDEDIEWAYVNVAKEQGLTVDVNGMPYLINHPILWREATLSESERMRRAALDAINASVNPEDLSKLKELLDKIHQSASEALKNAGLDTASFMVTVDTANGEIDAQYTKSGSDTTGSRNPQQGGLSRSGSTLDPRLKTATEWIFTYKKVDYRIILDTEQSTHDNLVVRVIGGKWTDESPLVTTSPSKAANLIAGQGSETGLGSVNAPKHLKPVESTADAARTFWSTEQKPAEDDSK